MNRECEAFWFVWTEVCIECCPFLSKSIFLPLYLVGCLFLLRCVGSLSLFWLHMNWLKSVSWCYMLWHKVKIIMESMDKILHSTIKRWGSVAAEEVYVDPHPTYPCHSGTAHLNPFHRTCTAFRGSGLVGSALLCPMPVKGSTGISWMSLCIFRWRPSPSPPGFRGCRLGFVKAKSCICYCGALRSSPPLGFCQRQYFPFAAPCHTAVRRFMLHFSMGGG